MAQQPLGIGLIGAGNIVKRHALAYRALPELSRLVAVADLDIKRAHAARTNFGFAHALDDHRELLQRDDVDVVDICTPANHHARLVIDALEAGKHVLCEKPMATTLADADKIIQAAERHPDLKVSFVFQLRSDATHRRMRLMIEQGLIGKLVTANVTVHLRKKPAYYTSDPSRGSWRGDGGGVLINQAIHQLDALLSFMGNPVETSAVMGRFVQPIEAEDTITGWVKFESGAFASIDCTVCAQSKNFSIGVVGENAGLQVSGDPDKGSFGWKIKAGGSAAYKGLSAQGFKLSPSPPPPPKGVSLAIQKINAKIKRQPWIPPATWGHAPFIREFLTAVRSGAPSPVPPKEGRRSLELAAALYESALSGKPIKLPLTETSQVYNGVDPENIDDCADVKFGLGARPGPVKMPSGARADSPVA